MKTTVPPIIDGIADDETWKITPEISGFKSFIPDFGKELPDNTTVKVAYDEENIYFAFKYYDNESENEKLFDYLIARGG